MNKKGNWITVKNKNGDYQYKIIGKICYFRFYIDGKSKNIKQSLQDKLKE